MAAPEDTGLLAPVWAGTPVHETTSDLAWLQAMLDAEAALARAQARLGLIPGPVAAAISAVPASAFDLAALAVSGRAAGNPVVPLVAALAGAVGPDATDHVHHGATSQDILDTATMLVCARSMRLIVADLDRAADALAELARTHRDTPMAGRTLTQHAVPITFGLKAAGWLTGLAGAAAALRRLILPVQLGGAAGTMSGYLAGYLAGHEVGAPPSTWHELPAAFAAELGLSAPVLPWHTDRSMIATVGSALAQTTGALGKLAVDVLTLSRTEIAEVTEPSPGGSSAMPHKQNPVLATLIRSAALQVPQHAATLALAMLAEDERPSGPWQAEWPPLRDALRLTGGAAHTTATLTEGLQVHPDRMRANLDLSGALILTERLLAALAPTMGKAPAKTLLTEAIAEATRTGRPLPEVLAGTPGLPDLTDLLDPTTATGAAGALVDQALRHFRSQRHPDELG